jgi:hypothetical protein
MLPQSPCTATLGMQPGSLVLVAGKRRPLRCRSSQRSGQRSHRAWAKATPIGGYPSSHDCAGRRSRGVQRLGRATDNRRLAAARGLARASVVPDVLPGLAVPTTLPTDRVERVRGTVAWPGSAMVIVPQRSLPARVLCSHAAAGSYSGFCPRMDRVIRTKRAMTPSWILAGCARTAMRACCWPTRWPPSRSRRTTFLA